MEDVWLVWGLCQDPCTASLSLSLTHRPRPLTDHAPNRPLPYSQLLYADLRLCLYSSVNPMHLYLPCFSLILPLDVEEQLHFSCFSCCHDIHHNTYWLSIISAAGDLPGLCSLHICTTYLIYTYFYPISHPIFLFSFFIFLYILGF